MPTALLKVTAHRLIDNHIAAGGGNRAGVVQCNARSGEGPSERRDRADDRNITAGLQFDVEGLAGGPGDCIVDENVAGGLQRQGRS